MNGLVRELDSQELAAAIESGEVDENKVVSSPTSVAFNLPAGSDLRTVMKHAQHMSARMTVLHKAHIKFSVHSRMSYNSGLEFERPYHDLHADIEKHEDYWFAYIFNVDNENPVPCEWTVGILGSLCTILRQRGELGRCMHVMALYMKVLGRYQRMTEGCGDRDQVACCDMLTYKANLIRVNCGVQLPDEKMAVTALRAAVAYEKREKRRGTFDSAANADFDAVLAHFVGHDRYGEVSDRALFKHLVYMNQGTEDEDNGPQIKLRICGYCGKQESLHGDFKRCARCHLEAYCSKKCQVSDWKMHKHLCGKKNTTEVEYNTLMFIINDIVKNYASQIERQTGHVVTNRQKHQAKIGLAKKIKVMLTGEFQRFNSDAIADAREDPAFFHELDEFFVAQPGFESWAFLRGSIAPAKKSATLTLSDEDIRSYLSKVVRHSMHELGPNLATKEGCVDFMQQHQALVDRLLPMMKDFLKEHPEYDSYSNIKNISQESEFTTRIGINIFGVLTDSPEVLECLDASRESQVGSGRASHTR